MMPSLPTIVLSCALAAIPVLAGSRAWESSIVYTHPSYTEIYGELFATEKTNSTNGTGSWRSANTLKKRYVTINPGTGNSDDHMWPDGKIPYCFESAATKELFFEDLIEARKLWENSGLGSSFDWQEKDSSYCNDDANRPKFLLIAKSDGLSCTVGVPPLNKMSDGAESRGPLMRLTADLDIGKQNLVANYAHQMGHAWGLHHEHQNPAFWSSDYAAAGGNTFSSSNFKCENLKDYASVSATLSAEQMKKACTSRAFAKSHRFSAAEYLPFTDSTAYRASKSVSEPDWDSIMIYDSGMGSVLTKPNGEQIKQVLAPSQRDVEGLKQLYGVSPSPKFNPLGSKSNSHKNKFNDIRKKERDSGCGTVPDDDPKGDVECSPATCGGGSCPIKRARAARATSNRTSIPRAIPATPDSKWGFLNKPTEGGLDAFVQEFSNIAGAANLVNTNDPGRQLESTSIFLEFKGNPFMAGVKGLYGCTSVVLTSRCGMFMSHHWELWWKSGQSMENFHKKILDPLTKGTYKSPFFLGFPELPEDCFTKEKNLKVTVFAPTGRATPRPKWKDRLPLLVSAVATSMSLAESDVKVQLYDASVTDAFTDDEQENENLATANGKVMLTYNNDIFNDGNTAAYQVWAGAQIIDGVLQANGASNSATIEDTWKPTSSRKRAILRYLGWA